MSEMIRTNAHQKLVEKYRPKRLNEMVGQENAIKVLNEFIARKHIPHLMLVGPPGCGKTTAVYALAREYYNTDNLKSCLLELNASDERGIDVIREKVKSHAQIKGSRIIFLDEADNLTSDAQGALRRIMETSPDTIFILGGNDENGFIDPIKSRTAILRFKKLSWEAMGQKIFEVCQGEGINISENDLAGIQALAEEADGDLRLALNLLEEIITSGKTLNAQTVLEMRQPVIAGIALKMALDGDFDKAKDMLEDAYINNNFNMAKMIRELYKTIATLEDRTIKIKLYADLGTLEMNCKKGGTPLVQLVSFIAKAWIIPHIPRGCNVLAANNNV